MLSPFVIEFLLVSVTIGFFFSFELDVSEAELLADSLFDDTLTFSFGSTIFFFIVSLSSRVFLLKLLLLLTGVLALEVL